MDTHEFYQGTFGPADVSGTLLDALHDQSDGEQIVMVSDKSSEEVDEFVAPGSSPFELAKIVDA
jgi:hypothetical protein